MTALGGKGYLVKTRNPITGGWDMKKRAETSAEAEGFRYTYRALGFKGSDVLIEPVEVPNCFVHEAMQGDEERKGPFASPMEAVADAIKLLFELPPEQRRQRAVYFQHDPTREGCLLQILPLEGRVYLYASEGHSMLAMECCEGRPVVVATCEVS